MVLASVRSGDLASAQRELARMQSEFPAAEGWIEGKRVNLVEALSVQLAAAASGRRAAREIPTGRYTARWSQPVVWHRAERREAQPHWEDLVMRRGPAVFASIADGSVFFQDLAGVHALDLATGKVLWTTPLANVPSEAGEPSSLRPAVGGPAVAVRSSAFTEVVPASRQLFLIAPAAPQSPVTGRVSTRSGEQGSSWAGALLGLDLDREGAISIARSPAGAGAVWAGGPVVMAEQVVVLEKEAPPGGLATLVSFDRWTGAPRWRTRLGRAPRRDSAEFPGMLVATLQADRGAVYVATQEGLVAAVRIRDGEPLWLTTYERRNRATELGELRMLWAGPSRLLLHGNLVVTAPLDCDQVLAFDAATGVRKWSAELTDADGMLWGVYDDRVVVVGQSVEWIDAASGAVVPQEAPLRVAAPEGQGVMRSGVLYVPRRQAIERLAIEQMAIEGGHTPGWVEGVALEGGANLVVAGDRDEQLLAVGQRQITRYERDDTGTQGATSR
jgi:outer membrane protein assembly factor BamB